MNHIQDLVGLSHEPPVQDFISAVHRNSAASGLFIQAIQSRCEDLSSVSVPLPAAGSQLVLPGSRVLRFLTAGFQLANTLSFCRRQPTTLKKTLQCLEGIHLSQSGAVLTLYVDKLLRTPFRVLARMVDTLACRRVEMLLAANLQVLKKTLILIFIENLAKQAKQLATFFLHGIVSLWALRETRPACVNGSLLVCPGRGLVLLSGLPLPL